jgi:hypothetical protein
LMDAGSLDGLSARDGQRGRHQQDANFALQGRGTSTMKGRSAAGPDGA